jgi:hypothetical protein
VVWHPWRCYCRPVFLDNKLTGVRYRQYLENTLQPYLDEMTLTSRLRFYFQQDGAPPHFSIVARQWLNQWLPGRWIGRRGPVEWPPRSPDLTPLNFFLWGHLKSVVCSNRERSIAQLQDNIRVVCAVITPVTLRRVRPSLLSRIYMCQQQDGHQFEHLYWCKVAKNLLNYFMLERFMVFSRHVWFCWRATVFHSWPYCTIVSVRVHKNITVSFTNSVSCNTCPPAHGNIAVTFYYGHVKSVAP